jgi:hypothetical protein
MEKKKKKTKCKDQFSINQMLNGEIEIKKSILKKSNVEGSYLVTK